MRDGQGPATRSRGGARQWHTSCVDLIYLEPEFNHRISPTKRLSASKATGASFKDCDGRLTTCDGHEHGELADRHSAASSVIEADAPRVMARGCS